MDDRSVWWFCGSKVKIFIRNTLTTIWGKMISFWKRDSLVVWLGSGVMGIAVDQECVVQSVQISEHEANVVSVWQALAPEIPRQHSWHENRDNWHDNPVVAVNIEWKILVQLSIHPNTQSKSRENLLLLDHNEWIGDTVAHINGFPFFIDFGTFGHHEPANVWEEESPTSVVRIGIAVLIFVMHPMIMHPHPDTILMGNCIEESQQKLQWPFGFVRFVRPQSMRTGCDSQKSENY